MSTNEFTPYEYFDRVISLWWLVALATILGGALGYLFYKLNPPLYEANDTYIVTIDLSRFPLQGVKDEFLQYNEDLALNSTEDVLLSAEVRDKLITQMKSLGIELTPYELQKNNTIERKQDVWELRYRNTDPQVAQEIVDRWAEIGYQTMLSWQAAGKIPDYVIFQPPTTGVLPQEPVVYDRNKGILAGALIGFIVGIIVTNLISRSPTNQTKILEK
jgi:uncharacterized protein involved in exopolysaccharide biosynthesis